MIRLGAFVWLVFLAFLGIGVFHLKYSVQAQEKELRKLRSEITQHLEAIHVLKAEWSYLNDPARLADLTRRHTDLAPITADQIADLTKIPVRTSRSKDQPPLAKAADSVPVLPLLINHVTLKPQDRSLIHQIITRIGQ